MNFCFVWPLFLWADVGASFAAWYSVSLLSDFAGIGAPTSSRVWGGQASAMSHASPMRACQVGQHLPSKRPILLKRRTVLCSL